MTSGNLFVQINFNTIFTKITLIFSFNIYFLKQKIDRKNSMKNSIL